jgi:electron transfer flavoprotein beta subunit
MLAELLGTAHATMVMDASVGEHNGLRVRRELDGGALQWWHFPMPCVLTVQAGARRLRHASIKGVMAAKKKPLLTVPVENAMLTTMPQSIVTVALEPPPAREGAERIEGTTADVLPRLAAILSEYRSR